MEVLLEAWVGGRWKRVGSTSKVEPPGSLTWTVDGRRDVYLFGFLNDRPGVWRSVAGADDANVAVRVVHTLGLELLSDLTQPYVLPVDDCGRQLRFTGLLSA